MTAQDYAKLHAMQARALVHVVSLLRTGALYAKENGLSSDLWRGLAHVARIVTNHAGARACVGATRCLEQLLPLCDQNVDFEYVLFKNGITVLAKKLRDLLVIRAQTVSPFGDPAAFKVAVDAAYGEPVLRGSQLHSLLMNSYRKMIFEKFDEGVGFKSESESNCKKKRAKRTKN